MYKQILVPVDGSQTALAALRHAVELARAFDAGVFVVHVVDIYPFLGVGADSAVGQAEYLQAATANANGALGAALAIAEAAGVACESATVEGHAAEEGILNTAGTCDADLIVMGSHGRRGIEKLLLGSVTQRVLQNARVPVLVVRGTDD
ncbi:universal stress protein [Pseudorhodoferax sp. Leaf274]|uniref:universal stress protein n=1 Tax=Pseudorhodoferax sp. Leaf274 TaxID=1736318 RepID=UPI0007024250|nr:universal stress protein [Pseudorhodoferax sp. Leaf274]KQP37127.1 universal stress protein UspA [Pseudorhodoferax sp. Leaf274]